MNAILNYFQRLDFFGKALLISIFLHVLLLTVRVAGSVDFERFFEDKPLEIVLVNAQSNTVPEKYQAIAQHNLEGGGDSDKKNIMASSPAPYDLLTEWGVEAERKEQQNQALLQEQMALLTQAKSNIAQMPQYSAEELKKDSQAQEEESRRKALLQQLGAIEKRINEENSRPQQRFVSPTTKAGSHAHYYAAFKDKVEDLGTSNFPTHQGKRLYGELSMIIYLDAHGKVLQTKILSSSGQAQLDAHAQAIVRAGAPYGDFTPEMLKEFGILVIASHFRFAQDVGLSTKMHDLR